LPIGCVAKNPYLSSPGDFGLLLRSLNKFSKNKDDVVGPTHTTLLLVFVPILFDEWSTTSALPHGKSSFALFKNIFSCDEVLVSSARLQLRSSSLEQKKNRGYIDQEEEDGS
jgi:hypothetical protein